ncbi:MAG: hypothetical protein A2X34_03290 [Elusimicrobia bacterium GWC2_51_8]|nr:MAG: hypothetical protein A2X33_06225 [Elusimicrobia bacterium GWA2_51_34]OGR64536.1 MAG: hypothetical protein A2X34_03290 [Elusimicrobia bacterium GWC2_51_8]OGR85225.1 MAG: hypothetical protein A2021_00590 [Elusimicrobia bacterium GWF2_52_66]HAF94735.1 two-component system response regulator [Elusimicrobiota bacterium]HCE97655.1 two-component system response regulator [Elusimicrobiota bacterium]
MAQKLILIVEDDTDLAFVIKTALEDQGYTVRTAKDGFQALEMAMEEPPELILLDLMLPKMDGYAVNLKLKSISQTADVPVIVLTAYGHLKKFSEMKKDASIVAYLEKPTPMKKVLEIIGKVLKPK